MVSLGIRLQAHHDKNGDHVVSMNECAPLLPLSFLFKVPLICGGVLRADGCLCSVAASVATAQG
jgi:hypothetical protein